MVEEETPLEVKRAAEALLLARLAMATRRLPRGAYGFTADAMNRHTSRPWPEGRRGGFERAAGEASLFNDAAHRMIDLRVFCSPSSLRSDPRYWLLRLALWWRRR